jgi:predicted DsbA family dithiol-disulfide isomerase
MSLTIAVFSDVICPWCYVGKRRLERALDELDLRASSKIRWLPFELNPDMPEEGMERSLYRARKFGAERSAMLDQQMTATGREARITFRFDRMRRTPNTRRAHMLIAGAEATSSADGLVEALFRAYFEEGRDIGNAEVLVEIAASAGVPRALAESFLADDQLRAGVVDLERQASRLNISGVPFFIVDDAWALSGAQSAATWMSALKQHGIASAAAEHA